MPHRDVNPTQGFGATDFQRKWEPEKSYWRDNWATRPYVSGDRGFDYYRPGYRYGFEAADRYRGRQWDEIEGDLRTTWDSYEHRGESTWEHIKDAVRDGWHRATHR